MDRGFSKLVFHSTNVAYAVPTWVPVIPVITMSLVIRAKYTSRNLDEKK